MAFFRVPLPPILFCSLAAALAGVGACRSSDEQGAGDDAQEQPPPEVVDIGPVEIADLLALFQSPAPESWRHAQAQVQAKIDHQRRLLERAEGSGRPYVFIRRIPPEVERRLPAALTSEADRRWLADFAPFSRSLAGLVRAGSREELNTAWEACAHVVEADMAGAGGPGRLDALIATLLNVLAQQERFRQELAAKALGQLAARYGAPVVDLYLGILKDPRFDNITKQFIAAAVADAGAPAVEPIFQRLEISADPRHRGYLYLALESLATAGANERLHARLLAERAALEPAEMKMQLLSRIVRAVAASREEREAGWILDLIDEDRALPADQQDRYWQETCFTALATIRGAPLPGTQARDVAAWRRWVKEHGAPETGSAAGRSARSGP
ncbi:MAG: hypothetical protein HY719_12490 [Planctomycetes bacterium]|nr:hypothetical protein [Planctomycetota bacterium]